MFTRLFATSGLSLDRLRALVEVGAAGSIVRASGGAPVRQSLYSRQINELEGFFQVRLTERQGKGIRLTPQGRELARISRFFLLGLSNFHRGCLTEAPAFRIGAGATFIGLALLPALAGPRAVRGAARHTVETAGDDEIERRLHDLTLDFGIVTAGSLSRPLQCREIGSWRLRLWLPPGLVRSERQAFRALEELRLPLALAAKELPPAVQEALRGHEPVLTCNSFLEARTALAGGKVGALLPDFVPPHPGPAVALASPRTDPFSFRFRLAWNPRLLRLNPHAVKYREALAEALARSFAECARAGAAPPRPAPRASHG